MASGRRRAPGLAAKQERHARRRRIVVADVDLQLRRAASPARAGARSTPGGELRGRRAGGRRRPPAAARSAVDRRAPARARARRGARRSPRARRSRSAASRWKVDHLGQRVAVLAAQIARSAGGARAPPRAAPGSSSIASPVRRSSLATSASSASRSAQPLAGGRERRPIRRARRRRAGGVDRAAVGGERARRRGAAASRCAVGVGEQVLRRRERVVLVGVVEPGGVELVDLEAQQVDLARPARAVAAERRQPSRRSR